MPVNLSASSDVMQSLFGGDRVSDDVDAPVVHKSGVGPSFSSDDLLDVNRMFEVRKSD